MPGAEHLRDCSTLIEMLKKQQQAGKPYGAVCASPAVVLQTHGLITAPGATCYPAPGFRATMDAPTDESVSVQNNVVTSQGPGTSLLFALALGEKLVSRKCYTNNVHSIDTYDSLFIVSDSMEKKQLTRLQLNCWCRALKV